MNAPDPEAAVCLRLLDEADWVVRRKLRTELLDVDLLRHHLSVDFNVPGGLAGRVRLPLLFLPKHPGRLFRFDFRDESGRSLPLPTRVENARWAARLLLARAAELLPDRELRRHRAEITQHLRFIAHASGPSAEGAIRRYWLAPEAPSGGEADLHARSERTREGWRGVLAADDASWRLLIQCATASPVVITLEDAVADQRRVVKLSYDIQLVSPNGWNRRFTRFFRDLGYRSLETSVLIPWAAGRTFHFECHTPNGLRIVGSAIHGGADRTRGRRRPINAHHDHLYISDGSATQIVGVKLWTRPRAVALGLPALALAALTTLLMALMALNGEWFEANSGSNNVGSLLLAIPGIASVYFSRPSHPITARLAGSARVCLLVLAFAAYASALRVAFVSPHTTAAEIGDWFWFFAALGALATAGLASLRVSALISYAKTGPRGPAV